MDQLNSEFRNEIFDHFAALKVIENGLASPSHPGSQDQHQRIAHLKSKLTEFKAQLDEEAKGICEQERIKKLSLKLAEIRQNLRRDFPDCDQFGLACKKEFYAASCSGVLQADYDDDDSWSEDSDTTTESRNLGGGFTITITKEDSEDAASQPASFPGINIGQSDSGHLNPFYIPQTDKV